MSSYSPGALRRGLPLPGLANQFRRESRSWWTTRRWWVQTLTWTGLVNGLLVMVLWVIPELDALPTESVMSTEESAVQFGGIAAMLASVAAVVIAQGILIDERRLGLLEWMLSKPMSRSALLLAKFTAHAAALLVTVVLIPWVGVWLQLSLARGSPWPVRPWLGAVVLVGLLAVFHLALVIALSATTWSRALVVSIPLAGIIGTDLLITAVPGLLDLVPWTIGRLTGPVLVEGALASLGPVVSAVLLTGVFLVAATWGLRRTEL